LLADASEQGTSAASD